MGRVRMRLDFPPEAVEICKILRGAGRECYIVGGAVRDKLMGREPSDVDFATDAPPEEVTEIFERAGCRVIPTGIKFGTVTVTCDGEHFFEVTTYRTERYRRRSRKPEVRWGRSIEEDLARRDFTINAMAYDPIDGVLIDPFGGLEDLRRGVIRAVGDAEERFREDPLRIVRMCRFAAVMNFAIDPGTFEAARRAADELSWIPRERIRDEFRKAFIKAEKPSLFVNCLVESGAMRHIIPEIYDLIGLGQPPPHAEDAYEHTLLTLDNVKTRDYELRMAALLHDIGKPETRRGAGPPWFPGHEEAGARIAERILRRLRHSLREIRKVVTLIRAHGSLSRSPPKTPREARRLLRRLVKKGLPKEWLDEFVELELADTEATLALPEERREAVRRGARLLLEWRDTPADRSELAISGRDLLEMGVEPRYIGRILEKLVDWVVEDPARNTREALLRRALVLAKSMGALRRKARPRAA